MKTLHSVLLTSVFYTLSIAPLFACTGGTNSGALIPTPAYQTVAITDGEYYTLSVTCGETYHFDFCNNGGSSGSLFPEITILDATGTTELQFAAYTGGCSELSFTSHFTGTIQVLVTDSGCFTSGSYSGTMAYNATGSDNATYSMNPTCGGSISTISGTPGGTFSWNPSDPGDGAVLNTTTGTITSAVSGTTYNTTYTSPCGSSSNESVTITGSTANCWTLNGDAQYIAIAGEQCIQLTDEINTQLGCAWNGSQIDFASDFTLTLDYYFGDNTNGADGNTFTFQSSSSTACGINGGQMGAGGMSNALSIEFDTYDNDNPTHLYDMACDHIAVEIDGDMQNAAPLCGPVCAKSSGGDIDDGGTYTVDIHWTAASQQLDIYFDNSLRLSCVNDFVTNAFAGNSLVYWGATSATGGLNNQQFFCPSTVVVLPLDMIRFENFCKNDTEYIQWETASERDLSHFQLEYTYNGLVFYPLAKIDATGNSQTTQIYEYEVTDADSEQRYYRMKSVDIDGAFEYSDIIRSDNCSSSKLIDALIQTDATLEISSMLDIEVSLINQLGQRIPYSDLSANAKTCIINKEGLSNGIYYIHVTDMMNTQQMVKVVISQ